MAIVTVRSALRRQPHRRAREHHHGHGGDNPGCAGNATAPRSRSRNVLRIGGTVTIALPYGAWTL